MAKKVPGLYRRPRSPYWWAQWSVGGITYRESTETTKLTEARAFLDARKGAKAEGRPIVPRLDKIRYEEVRDDLLTHYEATRDRDVKEAGFRLAHLNAVFTGRPVASIGPTDATYYTATRRGEGAADGTIRRELATLTTMLNLAAENGKLLRVPKLRKPPEGKPRTGFLEPDQASAVAQHLGPDLQVATAIGYTLGWRVREILSRQRHHLDLEEASLKLEEGRRRTARPEPPT